MNLLRITIITAIFAASFGTAHAQFPDSLFFGFWVGELTQDPGGIDEKYPFKMEIIVTEDHKVVGRTYANIYNDHNFANLDFTGTIFKGRLLTFQETKISDSTSMDNYVWCIKGGQLMLTVEKDKLMLDGYWQGVTKGGGACIPGDIHLEKLLSP